MIIQLALVVMIIGVLIYKSKQPPMTKEEQQEEIESINKRGNSFLTKTTVHPPYNGVE